ncbi:hypothetical protein IMCC3317_34300 [Kordia antarctica]|uniref:Uncharacterized protein n=1 Tax=Kordia antarctica TaxID=1218801 RepID=A0A7L4ZPC2_9FLAO|nr:hypothetical protein [Kordia antarctica]QHI38046.1 hypothetical protein IMCC3317_34300 [Kordia antarctica]
MKDNNLDKLRREVYEKHKETIGFLYEKYPHLDDLKSVFEDRSQREVFALTTIKKFTGFDYDREYKVFSKKMQNESLFLTETTSLEDIKTPLSLLLAIDRLNQSYELRRDIHQDTKQPSFSEDIILPPKEVDDISRESVIHYLKQHHDIDDENLFKQETKKQKKIIYDLYRNFTAHVPMGDNMKGIAFSLPDNPEVKLRYQDEPQFEKITSLFSLLREMRTIKKMTQKAIEHVPHQRIEALKRMVDKNNPKQDHER